MMVTMILAKFFGLYYLAVGFSFFYNPKHLSKLYQSIKKEPSMQFLGGILALFVGAFVVSIHNIWIPNWPVILTIIGWMSLIKGFGFLALPNFIDNFSFMMKRSDGFYRSVGLIVFLLGVFLLFKGW